MMDNKIIFKPEKGTASYNPLIDNIKGSWKWKYQKKLKHFSKRGKIMQWNSFHANQNLMTG